MSDKVMVVQNHRDVNGNAGMDEIHGIFPTLEKAKSCALAVAARSHAYKRLWWRQFSPTTWGVMSGQLYTDILVSLPANPITEFGGVR